MRFFNNSQDKIKFALLKAQQFKAAGFTVLFPTHSHQLAALIFAEAALVPGLPAKSKTKLLKYAVDVITPAFRSLCHKGGDPTKDISLVLHDKYGHDVSAMKAIIKVVNTNEHWKLWRKEMVNNCRNLYPEIPDSEWL